MRVIAVEVPDKDCQFCRASSIIGTSEMREIRCPFRTTVFNVFDKYPEPVKACREAEVRRDDG
jgi:hypothetical protein